MPDPQTHERPDLIKPNADNHYEVTANDLPLSCPMPGMALWNSHPKVYIPVHKTGQGKCPYCGADFFIKDFNPANADLAEHHRRE